MAEQTHNQHLHSRTHPIIWRNILLLLCTTVALTIIGSGCSEQNPAPPTTSDYTVPKGFPALPVPADNQLNDAKIELGRWLFYDARLSRNEKVACANCHYQRFAFADTTAVSIGVGNENGTRNSPAIINVAYNGIWFWDGRALSLEEQIRGALTSPIEMYADTAVVSQTLAKDTLYQRMFRDAFGSSVTPNTELGIKAIATFCRTLLSGNSRYDRFERGDSSALTEQERRGKTLFFSTRTNCSACHSGFNFTDNQFHSVALHTHYYDKGRYNVTHDQSDIGKFKTPTLRNITATAPYMNEGLFAKLEDVIEHYNAGGKPFINRDALMKPLNLTAQEKEDLIAFLGSLTDDEFINNPKFYNPRK